jgi:hypothetical protein
MPLCHGAGGLAGQYYFGARTGGAKIIEGLATMVDPENNKMHFDRPFSATLWGKEYTIRSVQGDIYHLFQDARSFVYHRLNPALIRPAIEAVTGRDAFGRIKDWRLSPLAWRWI